MYKHQEITLEIPEQLLNQIDRFACADNVSKDQFIQRAVRAYIQARKRECMRDSLRAGYEEMASLNLSIAQQWFKLENEGGEILLEDLTGGGDVADN